MSLLEVKNLTYTYGKSTPFVTHAVDNVSFKIEKGEIIGLIGHTGSGKSTIVQQLNGLIKPESGEVVLDGKNIWTEYKNISEVRFKVGLVFQYPEYQLFEDTCIKDISFGPKNMGLGEEEAKKRALEAARLVGLDEKLLAKSPFDLSGGEKRRVAIAGIIAMQPEVLVLDEPTAGLDPVGRDTVLSMIKEYRASTGAAVIIVSSCFSAKRNGKRREKGWLTYCFAAFLFMGLVGVLQKVQRSSSCSGSPKLFLLTAFVTAFVICLAVCAITKKDPEERPSPTMSGIACILTAGGTLAFANLANLYLAGALPSALLFPAQNGGSTLLSVLIAAVVFRERPDGRQKLALIASLCGLVILFI